MGELTAEGRRRAREAAGMIPGYNAFAAVDDARRRREAQRQRNAPVSPYEQRRRAAEVEAIRQRRLEAERQRRRAAGQPVDF